MKTVLLMRHAKSSWKDDALADDQRPLNKRGRHDAPHMGQLLRDAELPPQAILSSTAVRARETAVAVAEASGFGGEIQYDASLYAAPPEAYVAALRQLAPDIQVALVVGHNPGLEALVQELTGEDEHMPTAAIARVNLAIEQWSELSLETEGHLETIWRPREKE